MTLTKYSDWFTRGYKAYIKADYYEAYKCFKEASSLKPNGVFTLNNLAGVAILIGKIDAAEAACRRALSINNNCREALNNLGSALFRRNRFDQAEKYFREASHTKPDYHKYYYNHGNSLFKLKKFDQAEVSFQKAIDLKPDYLSALGNFAVLRQNQGRIKEALDLAKQALAIAPSHKQLIQFIDSLKKSRKP